MVVSTEGAHPDLQFIAFSWWGEGGFSGASSLEDLVLWDQGSVLTTLSL